MLTFILVIKYIGIFCAIEIFEVFRNFQLRLIYNIISVSGLQLSDLTFIQLTKWSPDKCSTHLTPYIIIRILSTIFPMLYFTSPRLFCNYQFVLLFSALYLFPLYIYIYIIFKLQFPFCIILH